MFDGLKDKLELGQAIGTDTLGMDPSLNMLIVQIPTTTIVLGWNSMLVAKVGIGTGAWAIEMPRTIV
jgi:hypothetical protein